MHKNRVEAFSDGVLAIVITIMVLELKVPHGDNFSTLLPLWPVFLSYLISFIYLAIYWNNHHHLFQAVKKVDGPILWANMHLLFWLSLLPFASAWVGENHFTRIPVALYGFILLMASIAYYILARALARHPGQKEFLSQALGKDIKGRISIVLYALAISISFWFPIVSGLIYIGVAIIWLIPDRRIEKSLLNETSN
jgi:uncharacterized membrane protein